MRDRLPVVEEVPPAKRRRPRRRQVWCKNTDGNQHRPVIKLNPYRESIQRYGPERDRQWSECGWLWWGWWRRGGPRWVYRCHHRRVCDACGKVIDKPRLTAPECPAYTPRPDRPGVRPGERWVVS